MPGEAAVDAAVPHELDVAPLAAVAAEQPLLDGVVLPAVEPAVLDVHVPPLTGVAMLLAVLVPPVVHVDAALALRH